MKKAILLLVLSCLSFFSYASHLIGGEMTYNCLGDNLYEITLIMYVDCSPSNEQQITFDVSGLLTIYDSSNNFIETIEITNPEVIGLSDETVGNECLTLPTDLCVLRGIYTVIVELPPIVGGYQLAYQRCCRNPSIINVVTPGDYGNTYTTNIPGSELISDCNSSPSFNEYPPLALCLGDDIIVDLSATDPDGDELVYSLTTPFHGADITNPLLITPPPFTAVPWTAGYSENYPLDANPAISIDANTGIITGTPNQMGMYIIGIKVEEYRDGVLINSVVRDFRFLIVDCDVITSSIPLSSWYCNSLTVSFTNGSVNANTYLWDFGNENATSAEFEPNYTYPDTGNYSVTLIANPNTICADTNVVSFPLYTELNPVFTEPDPQCLGTNSFSFEGEGIIPENAVFNWEFGTTSTPTSSNQLNPSNIVFPTVGIFPVSFNVVFDNCDETFNSTIEIYDEAIFPTIPAQASQCLEGNVFNFSAAGTYPTGSNFQWNFGSNANPQTSFQENPTAISFSSLGEQLITLNVLYNDCENAVQGTVQIIGIENLEIESTPAAGCEPFTVEFSSLLNPNQYGFEWNLDNGIVSNQTNPVGIYTEGSYDISLSVTNLNSLCKDSVNLTDYITVVPQPISSFSLLSDSLIYNEAVQITNNSLHANSFLYEFSSGYTSTEFEPEYTIPSIGDFTIWQYVQNQYECIDSSSVDLFVEFEHTFWVPNVFTPNNNLVNDDFYASYTNVESYRMQIFNRWGEIVFDQEGKQPKWDGEDKTRKDKLDKNQKSDTYVYLIEYKTIADTSHKLRGIVSLIR
ncbi:PKD domain-containing protein [bacterium]|nr:PKD domain-containing protein [bacterium]